MKIWFSSTLICAMRLHIGGLHFFFYYKHSHIRYNNGPYVAWSHFLVGHDLWVSGKAYT